MVRPILSAEVNVDNLFKRVLHLLSQDEHRQNGFVLDAENSTLSFPIEERHSNSWWRLWGGEHYLGRRSVMRIEMRRMSYPIGDANRQGRIVNITAEDQMGEYIEQFGMHMYHTLSQCTQFGTADTPANLLKHLNCLRNAIADMEPINEECQPKYIKITIQRYRNECRSNTRWIRLPDEMKASTRRLVYLLMMLQCQYTQLENIFWKYGPGLMRV